jgi:hypothetical protein
MLPFEGIDDNEHDLFSSDYIKTINEIISKKGNVIFMKEIKSVFFLYYY